MSSLSRAAARIVAGRRPLSRVSRYTARYHVPAAALEGLVAGVFTLNDVVLRKTFGAGAVLITLMVMAQPVSQLLAIVWANVMEGRSKRPFILGFGGVGRLSLLFVALATTPVAFAAPVVVSVALAMAIIPALNALYQSNYRDHERGRIFGWVMSGTALANIAASLAAGHLMDINPAWYRVIYPVAGILGLGSAVLYYKIRPRHGPAGSPGMSDAALGPAEWFDAVGRAIRSPFRGAAAVFRGDPNFLRFEVGYMLYGMAFMILQPVLPIFLVDEIKVQYSEAAMARGLIFFGMIGLLSPFFGRLLDRWNAVRLSILSFAMLVFFPLGLAASRSVGGVYGAFAWYGIAMTGVNIAWTMGPILFAGRRDAASYMGIHVTMVGIRGLVGNPLGLLLLQTIGSRPTFLAASALFVAATLVMLRLHRRMCREARPA
jgi:MFS family permease